MIIHVISGIHTLLDFRDLIVQIAMGTIKFHIVKEDML